MKQNKPNKLHLAFVAAGIPFFHILIFYSCNLNSLILKRTEVDTDSILVVYRFHWASFKATDWAIRRFSLLSSHLHPRVEKTKKQPNNEWSLWGKIQSCFAPPIAVRMREKVPRPKGMEWRHFRSFSLQGNWNKNEGKAFFDGIQLRGESETGATDGPEKNCRQENWVSTEEGEIARTFN